MKYILFFFLSIFLLIGDTFVQNKESYVGLWPVNINKDGIRLESKTNNFVCPNGIGCECSSNDECYNNNCKKHFRGKYCTLQEGDIFPEFVAIDQFGEYVNIYDFANKENKYILLEMGAVWCGPCNTLAALFAYGEEEIFDKSFWKDEYLKIYDMVKNDEVYFITVLYEDEFRDTATEETVYEWFSTYPDDLIPVLADEDKLLHRIIKPTGIPAVTLISPNMEVVNISNRGFNGSFDKLLNIIKESKNE